MTPRIVRIASAIARVWVGAYTIRMPAALRNDRRGEIEADLWDQQQEASPPGGPPVLVALHIVLRIILGMPDDLAWRVEASDQKDKSPLDPWRLIMSVSPKQMRWLGLSALVGGVLLAGSTLLDELLGNPGRVYTSETSWHVEGPMAVIGPIVGALMMALFIGGIAGLYVANRHDAGKVARAGFMMLAAAFALPMAGFVMSVILPLDGGFSILFNLLIVPPWVVLMPLGFLLLGIGLPTPIRRVPLVLGIFLTTKSVLGMVAVALSDWWPAAR
ncbi:MAG TPA: hypothetical protein VMN60_14155, partial [Longimicrobiales bacterium]|nr:hypothetical protein [Longimicrobiales bacterium]